MTTENSGEHPIIHWLVPILLLIVVGVLVIFSASFLLPPQFTIFLVELGSVLFGSGVIGLLIEIWLQEKSVMNYTAKQMVDQVVQYLAHRPEIAEAENYMYTLATKLVKESHNRLMIVQRSSPIILGPEHSLDPDFTKVLREAMNKALDDKHFAFHYYYSLAYTREKLTNSKLTDDDRKELVATVVENLKELKKVEADSGGRFRVDSIDMDFSGPIAIGDSTVGIWIAETGGGKRKSTLAVQFVSEELASGVLEKFAKMVGMRTSTLSELLQEMGLNLP